MAILVEADNLHKVFGAITAVDGISLTAGTGEVLGFLGPNGAGKSTTMKMITGFLEPDTGTSRVCGIDMAKEPKRAKRHIGYLPEGAPAYGDMTPRSFLRFVGEIRGLRGKDLQARVDEAAEMTGLGSVMRQSIDTLSKGYKRRVGLAQAILHDPDVLIMDEPTDGLDPNQKHHVRELIKEMASDKAIIVSTHILEEVEAVCTRAIVIDKGRIVADGTADELQRRMPYHNAVAIRVAVGVEGALRAELEQLSAVAKVEALDKSNGTVRLRALPNSDKPIAADVAAIVKKTEASIEEMIVERGRLDDVFRQITTSDTGTDHA
ncbi:MAG: ATP-binding cassette domain-containing protein [Hyphomicrobiales bacterium]|nr:ATP-binding cassette domain-containing protein [Hyphomicrobiales bacterium]